MKKKDSRFRGNDIKGFSIFELVIIIAIVVILIGALFPYVINAPKRSRDAAREGAISDVVEAIETYNEEKGEYPAGAVCMETIQNIAGFFYEGMIPEDPLGLSEITECTSFYYKKMNGKPYNYALVIEMEEAEINNAYWDDIFGKKSADYEGAIDNCSSSCNVYVKLF
jgi:type II secretory pathway pseudopilin PulG